MDETWPFASVASHIGWLISRNCFDYLDAPVELVTSEDVPMPYNHTLEPVSYTHLDVYKRQQNPATLQDAYDKAVASKDEEAIHRYKLLLSIPARLNDLVSYFEQEVFGPLAESQFKFALGLRLQVEDIAGNEMLDRIINYPSDINLDTHLMEGGVLLVNTAMGLLGRVGDIFGAFITMHFQNAVFRRPGDEDTCLLYTSRCV